MTETTRVFSISLPLDVAEQVERTAAAEGRSVSEIFEDSFRAYRRMNVQRLLSESQAAYQQAGLRGTEEEIERMIQEELQTVRQPKRG